MSNPFIGMTVGTWIVFLLTCGVADFKWWAWMLWVPWLMFATLAPLVWWWKHRKPNAEHEPRAERSGAVGPRTLEELVGDREYCLICRREVMTESGHVCPECANVPMRRGRDVGTSPLLGDAGRKA